MKCQIRADGKVYIVAKTVMEAIALNSLTTQDGNLPVEVDCSVLTRKEATEEEED